jgi:hypothetical protein
LQTVLGQRFFLRLGFRFVELRFRLRFLQLSVFSVKRT